MRMPGMLPKVLLQTFIGIHTTDLNLFQKGLSSKHHGTDQDSSYTIHCLSPHASPQACRLKPQRRGNLMSRSSEEPAGAIGEGIFWINRSVRTSDTVAKSLLLLLMRQGDEKNARDFYKPISVLLLVVVTTKTAIIPIYRFLSPTLLDKHSLFTIIQMRYHMFGCGW